MLRNILNIFLFNQTDGIPALHIEVASLHMHNALVDSIVDVSYTYITTIIDVCMCVRTSSKHSIPSIGKIGTAITLKDQRSKYFFTLIHYYKNIKVNVS